MTTLEALRVLDVSDGVAGAFCTRLFAGYGADVIVVEPPSGHPLRRHGPFASEERPAESGAPWLYLAAGKRSITLDITTRTGQTLLRNMAEEANVVVESFAPGRIAELGLGFGVLQRIKKRIVLTSITPFGQMGPRAHWKATNLTSYASGGQMSVTGDPDREPLLAAGYQAEYQAGLQAFGASAIAAHNADVYEVPQHVDISAQECMLSALELYLPWVAGFGREITPRRRGNIRSALVGIFPAKEGQVGIHVMPRQWPAFAAAIGRPDLIEDERFATERARLQNNDELEAIVHEWASRHTAAEAYRALGPQRVPIAPVLTIQDLLTSEHLRERAYFQRVEHPIAGEHTHPGAPTRLSAVDWRPARAPFLGEHTGEVLAGEVGLTTAELTRLRAAGVV